VTADGFVVSGTVDRLLVTKEAITLVDFKTGRNVPATAEEAPASHLRQMAAYVAALEIIFPNRPISAGLLYTAAPVLHLLARPLLAPLMPGAAVAGEGAAS
jgi:ATP-dependent helicase/nuclease subunit A